MNIIFAADHNGFNLKRKLMDYFKKEGHIVTDAGNTTYDKDDDFPDFVGNMEKMLSRLPKESSIGVTICGSGIGTSIAANKHKAIFCALCTIPEQAVFARKHAHANVIALPGSYLSVKKAINLINLFIANGFDMNERYIRRIKKIKKLP